MVEDFVYRTINLNYVNILNPFFRNRCQSPQLHKRQHLVEWTVQVQEKMGLCEASLHLAVSILDLFMDGHDIQAS